MNSSELELNFNWNETTKYLVLVNYYHGDIQWRKRLVFDHIVYSKEMPEREPFNAVNQAKSETNLLKFIYEFYDRLPQNVINVHQYEHKSYSHDGSIVDILNDPLFETKYRNSKTEGYWNFCCLIMGHAEQQVERMLQCGWWQTCMQPWFGEIHKYHDFTFMKRGCAQFVVSRERIRSLPREFYKNMYDWLVENSTGPSHGVYTNLSPFSNILTSRYMEWTWELIFAVYKESENSFIDVYNNIKMRALYGADNYQIDVTKILLQHCFDQVGRVLSIEKSQVFNEIFGDPICNVAKTLCLTIVKDDKQSETLISEHHESILINLS